ncbi:unnamed protein product, partial [Ixodes persulcatus]
FSVEARPRRTPKPKKNTCLMFPVPTASSVSGRDHAALETLGTHPNVIIINVLSCFN